jgi:hypothetical protein
MKRICIAVGWAMMFFVAGTFVLGFTAGFQAGFKNPNNAARAQKEGAAAIDKIMKNYSAGILLGSCVCAFVLAGAGVLPGTERVAAEETPRDPSASSPLRWGQMQLSSVGLARSSMTYSFDARYARVFLPNHVHRVYLADNELLLVNFKVGSLDPTKMVTQTTVAMGGGLIPALIAWCIAGDAQDQLTKMNNLLAGADQARVRQFLAQTRQGFTMSLADVQSAVLERPGFFDFAGADCKAILRLKHARWGQMTFHLLTDDDMGTAASELVSRLGERMKCKV